MSLIPQRQTRLIPIDTAGLASCAVRVSHHAGDCRTALHLAGDQPITTSSTSTNKIGVSTRAAAALGLAARGPQLNRRRSGSAHQTLPIDRRVDARTSHPGPQSIVLTSQGAGTDGCASRVTPHSFIASFVNEARDTTCAR